VSVTTDQVSVAWRYRELGVAAPFLRGTFLCPVTLADGSDGLVCTETADDSCTNALLNPYVSNGRLKVGSSATSPGITEATSLFVRAMYSNDVSPSRLDVFLDNLGRVVNRVVQIPETPWMPMI
jgi:hypothetical protein